MRTLAREAVFKYNYSKLFNSDDEGLLDVLIKDFNDDDKKFALELNGAINSNKENLIKELDNVVHRYKIDRILSSDMCIILIGMAESLVFPETPKPVIIDEAVKLASKFSTENSPNFVNGILAKFIKEWIWKF